MSNHIEIKDLTLQFKNFSLNNINLFIKEQEIFGIIGKTGSGKTTLLESIAGCYPHYSGTITKNNQPITNIPLEKRNIGFVNQDFCLFPHLTVQENIGYGLKIRRIPLEKRHQEIQKMAELLSISRILDQYPGTISGGEKQRAALARCLVFNPELLLLDEPFSALDPSTRSELIDVIKNINTLFKCTIVFVSHDFNDAQTLASRIGIMVNGELKQVCKSSELFAVHHNSEIENFLFPPLKPEQTSSIIH